jgi:tetratricopeptide (TPR) repeat protein
MMNRPAVTCAVCCLLIVLAVLPVAAQTKEQGVRARDEAYKLLRRARSNADLQKALRKYEQALHIFEDVEFLPGVAQTAFEEANVLLRLHQYDRALDYYERSSDICCKLGYEAEQGPILLNMGVAYFDSGAHDKALRSYEQALAIALKVKHRRLEGFALGNIAEVSATRGQHEKAWKLYGRSLAIFRKLGDMAGQAMTLRDMAKYCWSQGKYFKALKYHVTSRLTRLNLGQTADMRALLQKLAPKQ